MEHSSTMTHKADLYPSRAKAVPELLERKDPVIYPGCENMGPLTRTQLDFYEQNGYLHIDRFFSDEETDLLREELKQIWKVSQNSDRPEVIREHGSQAVRSVFAVHRDNAKFQALTRHEQLLKAVQQILGSEVYVHQSRINFKPGFTGKEFYWHSDFETWHVEDGMPRMRALSCSISLEANDYSNGPLMVIPGSHKTFVACVGETPDDHYKESLRKQEYGVPDQGSLTKLVEDSRIDIPVGPAGSVTLFDCNIMHGSNSNISPFPRSNVFVVYNSVENGLVAPFSGKKARPEFIGHREYK